jgi:hypothetical protein
MAKVRKVKRKKAARKKAISKDGESLKLPHEPNEPPRSLLEYAVVLYGRKGIGKTALSAMFPSALTFMFEPGRKNLEIYQIPQRGEPNLTWKDFLEYIELFIQSDYNTAVIDTLDRCYQACFDHVCHSRGVKHPQSLGNESYYLWDEIALTFEQGLYTLLASEKGVVFISHDKVRKTELHNGEVLEMIEPSCKPAAYRFIQTVADFVFYYTFKKNQRVLYLQDPSGYVWCSNGVSEHFQNPDGTPIHVLPMSSNSPQRAFKDLMAGYDNEGHALDWEQPRQKKKLPRKRKVSH